MSDLEKVPFDIDWADSFLLDKKNPGVSKDSMREFLKTIKEKFLEGRFSELKSNISKFEKLDAFAVEHSIFETVSDIFGIDQLL